MEDLYAQRVELPLWGVLLIYGIGAACVCGVGFFVGVAASYGWEGPLRAFSYGVVCVAASAIACFIGLSILVVSPSTRREGVIVRILIVILVGMTMVNYWQCKEPSASKVFESVTGYAPDDGVCELRSFISMAEWQDATIGLQFRVTEASWDRLRDAWSLKDVTPVATKISSVHASATGINPVPRWFANSDDTARLRTWSFGRPRSYLNVFFDVDHSMVYVIVQEI